MTAKNTTGKLVTPGKSVFQMKVNPTEHKSEEQTKREEDLLSSFGSDSDDDEAKSEDSSVSGPSRDSSPSSHDNFDRRFRNVRINAPFDQEIKREHSSVELGGIDTDS